MMTDDFPYANTQAAKMLANALARAREERGQSLRQIGKELGYKQAVVLSHMATGRVPIPIDRAEEFAEMLDLDKGRFLTAVVEQRHPEVNWGLVSSGPSTGEQDPLGQELEAILGKGLKSLSVEQRMVLREVASSSHPRQRWLTPHEQPVMLMIRHMRPAVDELGLDAADIDAIRTVLAAP